MPRFVSGVAAATSALLALCICPSWTSATIQNTKYFNPDDLVPPPPVVDAMPPMPIDVMGQELDNLTVFILPHSHDDTGWQRNVDQYVQQY